MTADRLAQWLVRHHPRWWRKRYADEVLALLESDRPGAPAVADLARSCARTWFECQLPSSEWGRGPWWLVSLRFSIQLPLAAMTATVMAVATVILLISALTWGLTDVNRVRPADFVLLLLAIVGPIAASGSIAIGAGLTRVAERFPLRVTAACLRSGTTRRSR